MPIRAFFKMYQEAIHMEAAQYREQLDIAIVPAMKFSYYKEMRSKYNSLISRSPKIIPKKPPDMHIDAASPDARNVMMGVFSALKRGLGYGG